MPTNALIPAHDFCVHNQVEITFLYDLARRDLLDSTRAVSPLIVPQGAVVVDTTARPIDEVVDEIVAMLK